MLIVEEKSIRQWISMIKDFLNTYGWLADSFVLDFYQENHWNRLPKSWQEFLPTLSSPSELGVFLDLRDHNEWNCWKKRGEIPPLGILALRACTKLLSLPRNQSQVHTTEKNISKKVLQEFKNLFSLHVKPKKRHEIEQFCKVVSEISMKTGTKEVFDVGSGLGHLSRYLTYGCGLNLTCIDSVNEFGKSATKFDSQLEQFLAKKQDYYKTSCPPTHRCLKLELNKHEKELQIQPNFGIIGLHSCGNLSPVIIHNFVNSPAKFLVSVGCCYMKLDEDGFPLSEFGKSVGLRLSYEAREVSCHAIEQYIQRLKDGRVTKLMTHAYRATLETILIKHYGIRRAGLRGIRNCEKGSFKEYAIQAIANLEGIILTDDQLCGDIIDTMIKDWYKVVLFFSLRLLVANVVETLVMLDRSIFIKEKFENSSVKIISLFDPFISPRNFAIVAEK